MEYESEGHSTKADLHQWVTFLLIPQYYYTLKIQLIMSHVFLLFVLWDYWLMILTMVTEVL